MEGAESENYDDNDDFAPFIIDNCQDLIDEILTKGKI